MCVLPRLKALMLTFGVRACCVLCCDVRCKESDCYDVGALLSRTQSTDMFEERVVLFKKVNSTHTPSDPCLCTVPLTPPCQMPVLRLVIITIYGQCS